MLQRGSVEWLIRTGQLGFEAKCELAFSDETLRQLQSRRARAAIAETVALCEPRVPSHLRALEDDSEPAGIGAFRNVRRLLGEI